MTDPIKFSIDRSMAQDASVRIQREIDLIEDRLNSIFEKALVKDYPVAQSIVQFYNPSYDELIMLSKVFERIAGIIEELEVLKKRKRTLKGITTDYDWLYSEIGAPDRDVDAFLANVLKTNEKDENS